MFGKRDTCPESAAAAECVRICVHVLCVCLCAYVCVRACVRRIVAYRIVSSRAQFCCDHPPSGRSVLTFCFNTQRDTHSIQSSHNFLHNRFYSLLLWKSWYRTHHTPVSNFFFVEQSAPVATTLSRGRRQPCRAKIPAFCTNYILFYFFFFSQLPARQNDCA